MRVYRYEIEPGATASQHTHARPYLLVAATDADLRTTSLDGRSTEHSVKPGYFRWIEANGTHAVMNIGTSWRLLHIGARFAK